MAAARQYDIHEAETHFSQLLEQVANGEEVVISEAGEPVAKVVPVYRKVERTGCGSLKGKIHIVDDFDDMPEGWDEIFGR